jgi:hypothetical protein
MLLLLTLACTPADPYAGCTVTAVVTDGSGLQDSVSTVVYDEEGREVSARTDRDGGRVESFTTWEGECPVLQRWFDTSGQRAAETTTTCDEHGDVTLVETVAVEEIDGVSETSDWGYTYVNGHDDEGRLVHVRMAEHDDGIRQQVLTYTWGRCNDPIVSGWHNDGSDNGRTELACNASGQPTESNERWFDADGELASLSRRQWTYDALGRWSEEVRDTGPDTPVILAYTARWGDLAAPGPAEVRGEWPDERFEATWSYSYDCRG